MNEIKQKPLISICDHLMIKLALFHKRFSVFIFVHVKCTASSYKYFLVLLVCPEREGEVGMKELCGWVLLDWVEMGQGFQSSWLFRSQQAVKF